MRVLVLGAQGNLGRAVCEVIQAAGDLDLVAVGHSDCDITVPHQVQSLVSDTRPDAVVLTAAYTNVDQAEQEEDQCFLTNLFGAENAARACRQVGARLVAFSTDFVFDGEKGAPYLEEDRVRPKSVYAASKAAMEKSLPRIHRDVLILRVGNLFGPHGKNFPSRLPSLLATGAPIQVDGERTMAPTSTLALARQILLLLREAPPPGLYHAACHGQATWADFARFVARDLELSPDFPVVSTSKLGLAAERPKASVLRNRRLSWLGLDIMPDWQDAAHEFVAYLKQHATLQDTPR